MANLITLPPILAPPSTIDIVVDFYNKEQKARFANAGLDGMLGTLPRTLRVPTSDFCAYYLYYLNQNNQPGLSSHDKIAALWARALYEFDRRLEFRNSSLGLVDGGTLDNATTERLGEAIGLSVASELHSLHQADWQRIKITKTKTLDFSHQLVASTGMRFVEVEAKGSVADDNRKKSNSVSKHKASVDEKKTHIRQSAPSKTTIHFGTIGVLDSRPSTVLRCWLIDPPANIPDSPSRFRIVSRLRFIADLVSLVSPRSAISTALQTRVKALEQLTDIASLADVALRRGNGSEFDTLYLPRGAGMRHPFFQGRSVVRGEPVGGQIFMSGPKQILFIGIREELLSYCAKQSFGEISQYSFEAKVAIGTIECLVSFRRFNRTFRQQLSLPQSDLRERAQQVQFAIRGPLYFTRCGLVFGFFQA